MLEWSWFLLSALVLTGPVTSFCQVVYNTQAQTQGEFRVLINRDSKTGVFSGDFNHGTNQSDNALATLNKTFTGQTTGLEVFNVVSEQLTPAELCASLKDSNADVTSCEPDFLVKIDAGSATPNDPSYAQQWNMANIQMPTAWKGGQYGNASVLTCVIDTGVDFTHPDLVSNLWMNEAEMNGPGANAANGYQNGIDDDGNGIIDDIFGANFVDGGKDGNVQDQNGHGTFIVGVVGAVGNNELGVTGINQVSKVMSCRFMDATGNGWVSDAIRCMDYCFSFNTHVIQASWGGVAYSDSLQTAINQASNRGVLFVCSAGNEAQNTDTTAHFPSSLPDDIIISVGASINAANNSLWTRSNYGKNTVDIVAPGVNILSTGLGGLYITLSGTSMSAPHVSGVAALMLAQYLQNGFNISTAAPNKGLATDLKKLIMSAADAVPGAQITSGHLNAGAALALVPLAAAASTESFGGNVPEGQSIGAVQSYNPTQTGSSEPFSNGGEGGLGGSASVSIDNSGAMNETEGPAPSGGFSQTSGPTATPPLPAAVEAGATQFQQTFGRRLHSSATDEYNDDLASSLDESSGSESVLISQPLLQRELSAHEARLRDILAEGQHL